MTNLYQQNNRLLKSEIEALKFQVEETEKDIITLKTTHSNSRKMCVSARVNTKDFSNRAFKDESNATETIEEQPTEHELEELKYLLINLSSDVRNAKRAMDELKEEEGYYKEQLEIINQILLHILNLDSTSRNTIRNPWPHIDLERVITENCRLSQELQEENDHSLKNKVELKSSKVETLRH